ncbi:hypothetical protein MYSTI_00183 [Myxococcus stipitatus DSM 14675]|uniref:Fibril protein n=1 Tax=Myxococcus stipitatus (strain DSM 14675 / JCM 12634 / Mx s8) TaxID=1278073 RepID=L7U1S4_MYXSD|nr:hypothetical protein [Myxococcus stipitatus]AGC41542.1 hypothetical protein MYSTI_00183 [Myxococcus stipitatus DSM 14675]
MVVSLRIACLGVLLLSACASSTHAARGRKPREATTSSASSAVKAPGPDSTYGYRAEDPVRVGWGNPGVMAFFELLRGPQGQRVAWKRMGPCCDNTATPERSGLEVYEVSYEGLNLPVRLFIDPNHGAAIRAPHGFTIEGLTSREPPPEQPAPPGVIEL